MVVLVRDQNQGIRNDDAPTLNCAGCRDPFSFIRTVTVGFGVAPNLLTLLNLERSGEQDFPNRPQKRRRSRARASTENAYRRWGISPRPENMSRPDGRPERTMQGVCALDKG